MNIARSFSQQRKKTRATRNAANQHKENTRALYSFQIPYFVLVDFLCSSFLDVGHTASGCLLQLCVFMSFAELFYSYWFPFMRALRRPSASNVMYVDKYLNVARNMPISTHYKLLPLSVKNMSHRKTCQSTKVEPPSIGYSWFIVDRYFI